MTSLGNMHNSRPRARSRLRKGQNGQYTLSQKGDYYKLRHAPSKQAMGLLDQNRLHGPWQASQQTQTFYFIGDIPLEGRGPGIL